MCAAVYVRWKGSLFALSNSVHSGPDVFSALPAAVFAGQPDATSPRDVVARHMTPGHPLHGRLVSILEIYFQRLLAPSDTVGARRMVNLLCADVQETASSNGHEVRDEDRLFLCSVVAGTRIVALVPSSDGPAVRTDTLQLWESVLHLASAVGLALGGSGSLGVRPRSPSCVVYHHNLHRPLWTERFNHYSYLQHRPDLVVGRGGVGRFVYSAYEVKLAANPSQQLLARRGLGSLVPSPHRFLGCLPGAVSPVSPVGFCRSPVQQPPLRFRRWGNRQPITHAWQVADLRNRKRQKIVSEFGVQDMNLSAQDLQRLLRSDPTGASLFEDFEQSPTKAVLLHYLNSGLFSFHRWKEYSSEFEGKPIDDEAKADLQRQVLDEVLSDDELREILREFLQNHSYCEKHLHSCGACGVREWARPGRPKVHYVRRPVGLTHSRGFLCPLLYTEDEEAALEAHKRGRGRPLLIPVDERGGMKRVEVWRARSVFRDGDGRHWHLHPELVDEDENGQPCTLLCPSCNDAIGKGDRPDRSIAKGLDLGHFERLGLELPNLHEQLMLARSRMYFAAIKVSDNRKGQANFNLKNRMKCHAILFPTREANTVPYLCSRDALGEGGLLDLDFLKRLLAIYCLDDSSKPDELMRLVHGSNEILGRPWVLAQWILVLQRCHKHYHDIDVSQPLHLVREVNDRVNSVVDHVVKTAKHISDKAALADEMQLGCDVTENQKTDTTSFLNRHLREELCRQFQSDSSPQSMRYSYIATTEEGCLMENSEDFRLKALCDLADLKAGDLEEAQAELGAGPVIENISLLTQKGLKDRGSQSSPDDDTARYASLNSLSDEDGTEPTVWHECDGQVDGTGAVSGKSGASLCASVNASDASASQGSLGTIMSDESAETLFGGGLPGSSSGAGSGLGDMSENTTRPGHQVPGSVADSGGAEKRSIPSNQETNPSSNLNTATYTVVSTDEGTLSDAEGAAWDDTRWEDREPVAFAESARDMEPHSEFLEETDHAKIMSTSFPHVFMLGEAPRRHPGRLNHLDRRHLLHQFTLVPSQDRRFLGYLFDMKQRISVMDGVKAHVNGSRRSLRTVEDLLNKPSARLELKEACRDSRKPGNWKVLKKYLPHLSFSAKDVSYGAAEGNKYKWRAMEMNKRYSSANCFLTISPTTLDNPRSIRMAFRTKTNRTFPAAFEEGCPYGDDPGHFIDCLRRNTDLVSEGEVRLPEGLLSRSDRADLAMNNPVAFVAENKALLSDIVSLLIGLDIEDAGYYGRTEADANRKTRFYRTRKGIFGHPLYAAGVTEDHSRGTLHWHVSLLAGIPPYALQRFHDLDGVCQSISTVLDTMYSASLPEHAHVGNLVQQVLKHHSRDWKVDPSVVRSLQPVESLLQDPDPLGTLQAMDEGGLGAGFRDRFLAMATECASQHQHHRHCKTCFKNVHGERGCRFDMPCGPCEETGAVTLAPALAKRTPANVEDGDDVRRGRGQSVPEAAGSYVVTPNGLKPSDRYRRQPVLNDFSKPSIVIWETKHPTIQPSLLPGPLPPPSRLQVQEAILRIYQSHHLRPNNRAPVDFHQWLTRTATDHQVIELWKEVMRELPGANRLVATFNPTLSYCTGSHNNASLLGALDQAKSALFYLVPYQGKTKFPMQQSLPVFNDSLNYLDHNKSKHPTESGMAHRTIKHLLTRTLNRLHLKMEVSDYEIAASLLDLPSVISSDRFKVGHPRALAAVGARLRRESNNGSTGQAFRDLCNRIEGAVARQKGRDGASFGGAAFRGPAPNHGESESGRLKEGNANRHPGDQPSLPTVDAEDLLVDYGFIKKLSVVGEGKKTHLLVPDVSLYLHRDAALEDINYYEYLGCFDVVSRKENESDPDNALGRKKRERFPLSPSFPASCGAFHAISAKQKTPLFIGKPPRHPGLPPEVTSGDESTLRAHRRWKEEADAFARFYLTLFRPHRASGSVGPSYGWEALVDWVEQLRRDGNIFSKFRLMIMHQHIKGMSTLAVCKTMARDYRARNRRLWSDREKWDHKAQQRKRTPQPVTAVADALDEHCVAGQDQLSAAQNTNMSKQMRHERSQNQQMHSIFGSVAPSESRITRAAQHPCRLVHSVSSAEVNRLVDRLRDYRERSHCPEDSEAFWGRPGNRKSARDKIAALRDRLSRSDVGPDRNEVNHQQLYLFDLYSSHFLRETAATRPPQLLLCHGGPGVGKSVIRRFLDEAARATGRFCFKTSFNAINAIEMGGNTTASQLNLVGKRHRNQVCAFNSTTKEATKVQDLRNAGFNKDSVVIVEEVSNQAPWHLLRLSKLCQAVIQNYSAPFGGAMVLLIGDLTQLGPVKAGPTLTCAVMDTTLDEDLRKRLASSKKATLGRVHLQSGDRKEHEKYCYDHPHTAGSRLFTLAHWFELTQQQRSEDNSHTELITNTYRGNRLTLGELKDRDYKILSREDATDHEWIRAPILVATNRERHTLTHTRAIQFAKAHDTVVIRWPTRFKGWKQKPLLRAHRVQAMEDPCFYEYFVEGADAFLTQNIQKDLKLTNATAVVYHSLTFEDPAFDARVKLDIQNARPGQVLTLLSRPLSVNVELQLSHDVAGPRVRKALRSIQLKARPKNTAAKSGHATYVIPIAHYSCKTDNSLTTVRGGRGFLPSKVKLQRFFPLEAGFAITVHKSEGRTMKRVIIALSKSGASGCDFTFAQVHVAFSRVKQKDHIRLLLTGSTETEQWSSLKYLGNLHPKPSIRYFFDGYRAVREFDHPDPNQGWLSNSWCPRRANAAHRQRESSSS